MGLIDILSTVNTYVLVSSQMKQNLKFVLLGKLKVVQFFGTTMMWLEDVANYLVKEYLKVESSTLTRGTS